MGTQVNTSRLGEFSFNKSSSTSGISGILSGIEGDIEGDINGVIGDLAQKLNIHDFYSAHVLDFCEVCRSIFHFLTPLTSSHLINAQSNTTPSRNPPANSHTCQQGYYTPSALPNASDPNPSKNVTRCSNRTSLYVFDPTAILSSELNKTVSLSDLKWPSAIQDAVKAVRIASKVMFVCYCIGAACAAAAILGGIVGILFWCNLTAFSNTLLDLVSIFINWAFLR